MARDGSSEGDDKALGWQTPWDQSFIIALDARTGRQRWKASRGLSRIAHVTPIVARIAARDVLVSPAGDVVQAFDLATGARLWSVASTGEGVVPSPVVAGGLVVTVSGFGAPAVRAVRPGAAPEVAWEQTKGVPMQASPVASEGFVFLVSDTGILSALDQTQRRAGVAAAARGRVLGVASRRQTASSICSTRRARPSWSRRRRRTRCCRAILSKATARRRWRCRAACCSSAATRRSTRSGRRGDRGEASRATSEQHRLHHGYRRAAPSCSAFRPSAQSPLPRLKVSDDKRFLVTADGKPFFWLGDTAWELFHRLNREDAEKYLKNRAERRFTVVQAVVLAELDGLNDPNAYGERPLVGNDPAQAQRGVLRARGLDRQARQRARHLRRHASHVGRQVEQEVGRRAGDLHGRQRRGVRRVAGATLQGCRHHLDPRRRSPGRIRRAHRHHARHGAWPAQGRRRRAPAHVSSHRRQRLGHLVSRRRLAGLQHAAERPRRPSSPAATT